VLDLADGPVSIEAWVKRADTPAPRTILQKGTGAYQLAFRQQIGLYKYGTRDRDRPVHRQPARHHDFPLLRRHKTGATTKIYVDGLDVTAAAPTWPWSTRPPP